MTRGKLKCFVINLDTSVGRMISFKDQIRELSLPFERVPAFDARALDLSTCTDYNPERSRAWFGESVTNGEYGCHKSHLLALRQFLNSDADYGLVLEDDIRVARHTLPLIRLVRSFLDESPEPWHLVHLGRVPKLCFREVASFPFHKKSVSLLQAYHLPYSAFALLWTRAGAELFLAETTEFLAPVDVWLSSWSGRRANTLILSKPPFAAQFVTSDIDSATEHRDNRVSFWRDNPDHPAYRRRMADLAEAEAKMARGQAPF
jgi:glycosyl transferase, family 25